MPCCASICGTSRTLLRKARWVCGRFLTAVLGFVISLLGAVGFVGTAHLPDVSAGAVCRHSGRWNRGTSATSRRVDRSQAVSPPTCAPSNRRAAEHALYRPLQHRRRCRGRRAGGGTLGGLRSCAPATDRGAGVDGGNDSKNLGRFLPKVAQVMAAAIENQRSDTPEPARPSPADSGYANGVGSRDSMAKPGFPSCAAAPPPAQGLSGDAASGQSGLAVYALARAEQALLRGELVYLAPLRQLNYSVQALWSWLLVAVRFREHIIGLIAVAPKSVAQVFTPTTESLLLHHRQPGGARAFCAGLSEQLEARRRTQRQLLHEQAELAMKCPGARGPGRTAGHAGGRCRSWSTRAALASPVRCGSVRSDCAS